MPRRHWLTDLRAPSLHQVDDPPKLKFPGPQVAHVVLPLHELDLVRLDDAIELERAVAQEEAPVTHGHPRGAQVEVLEPLADGVLVDSHCLGNLVLVPAARDVLGCGTDDLVLVELGVVQDGVVRGRKGPVAPGLGASVCAFGVVASRVAR